MIDPQKSEAMQMKRFIDEQPKAILNVSIKNALETIKRIQRETFEDQTIIHQTIENLHNLQTESINTGEFLSLTSARNTIEPNSSPRQVDGDKENSEGLRTNGSEMMSTGCDEETKLAVHLVYYFR